MKAIKIETVIKNFEFAIKEYSKAVKELPKQIDKDEYLCGKDLINGLCWFFNNRTEFCFFEIWDEGYYSKISDVKMYLYKTGENGLNYRIKWMKQEVKELKELIKKGYTHL